MGVVLNCRNDFYKYVIPPGFLIKICVINYK